ncbi:rRNA maturation RNase YbeY [Rhodophyticola porphyridii]|uniref:Endoribonuclease YbeY n=1 Tax=Rhodophyticola porphyridii TaxID=1852017 RepID=A0A3L9Y5C3_9RHOB|nr:rRNA maturation RNase YbeY [Rhodophyticola porphyridii]RMA43974.1 rRNA maturation RNase YbeY [Rhodophyticola porphyridii]
MEIDCLIEDPAWETLDLEALARRVCAATLDELGLQAESFGISLLACNDSRIAELNAEFRGKPAPTNVLSWPSEPHQPDPGRMPDLPVPVPGAPPHELGDIAIAYGVCLAEAEAQKKSFADHVAHLLVHGTLHLLGFDHINDADATLMEDLETRILARLGIPDPY